MILYVILVNIIILRHFTTFVEPSSYGRIILLISDYSNRIKEKFKAKLKHNEGEMYNKYDLFYSNKWKLLRKHLPCTYYFTRNICFIKHFIISYKFMIFIAALRASV